MVAMWLLWLVILTRVVVVVVVVVSLLCRVIGAIIYLLPRCYVVVVGVQFLAILTFDTHFVERRRHPSWNKIPNPNTFRWVG